MPLFLIVPVGEPGISIDFVTDDEADVFGVMQRSGCAHADVFRDGAYLLSARLGDDEVWSIYTDTDRATSVPARQVVRSPKHAQDEL